jgi:hypothetical protein
MRKLLGPAYKTKIQRIKKHCLNSVEVRNSVVDLYLHIRNGGTRSIWKFVACLNEKDESERVDAGEIMEGQLAVKKVYSDVRAELPQEAC